MTNAGHAGDDVARDPLLAAAFDDLKPYIASAAVVSLLGAPAEVLVPVVRRLRGDTGVALGPGLASLGNGLLALSGVHFFRQRPQLWQEWRARIPRWSGLAGIAYVTLSPAAVGGWQRGVVLRRRSPLWGTAISPVGLLQVTLLLVGFSRARRARDSGTAS